MINEPVGIDAIATYVPPLYLDLTGEWATTRAPQLGEASVEKLVGKVTQGVGVRKMAIVDAHEDAATMAAMAAKKLIDQTGIAPEQIDYLAVGTETTVDQSKSIAAYVQGMLARHYKVDMSDCGAPQFQFACIGATYALEAAVARIRAGDNDKPYAIVIATDISKYPLQTAGEYTQGAGAVAMLIAKNPRMLVLEQGAQGTSTRDERDFFRPNGNHTAVVDGKYSIDVYLDLVRQAFGRFRTRLEAAGHTTGRPTYEAIEHFLFHVPFPRMAEYAASSVFLDLWQDDADRRTEMERQIPSPLPTKRRDHERALAKTPLFQEAFKRKSESSLTLSRDVGNVYSGSLYLALQSLLEHASELSGQRVVFCSYGSGASAKVFSGIFQARYREGFRPIAAELTKRRALSVADYERLHAHNDKVVHESLQPAKDVFALQRLGIESSPQRTDVGYRYYDFV